MLIDTGQLSSFSVVLKRNATEMFGDFVNPLNADLQKNPPGRNLKYHYQEKTMLKKCIPLPF